jgi:hypothetical protein
MGGVVSVLEGGGAVFVTGFNIFVIDLLLFVLFTDRKTKAEQCNPVYYALL